MKTLFYILVTAIVVALSGPKALVVDDSSFFRATHETIFVTTTDTMKMEWCIDDNPTWKPDAVEMRGWEYGRGEYYSIPDIDGIANDAKMSYKIPLAGMWKIESRYYWQNDWSDWYSGTDPNNNVVACGSDGISPNGWWVYARLGSITGGGID